MYYAVIGRIPFDDEDSLYLYDNVKDEDLYDLFVTEIYADSERDDQKEVEATDGTAVFITHIVVSESPIKHLHSFY